MVRGLDLKKPPSIAESIDWARALILLGATDIDESVFERTMSIIVKHRTDLDVVAERVGVRLDDGILGKSRARLAAAGGGLYGGLPEAAPPGLAPQLLRFCDELRSEGVRVGTAEILDAFRALGEVSWTDREDFRETLAATLAKSQEDRRVFELRVRPLLLPRGRGRGGREGPQGDALRGRRADRPRRPAPADPGRDPRRAATARWATSRGSRWRPSAARARAPA